MYRKTAPIYAIKMKDSFEVKTLEGIMTGKAGDYLAMGVKGEMWPIAQDIFKATYTISPICYHCGSPHTFFNDASREWECRICESEFDVKEE